MRYEQMCSNATPYHHLRSIIDHTIMIVWKEREEKEDELHKTEKHSMPKLSLKKDSSWTT